VPTLSAFGALFIQCIKEMLFVSVQLTEMVTLVRLVIAEIALLTAFSQGLPVVSYRGRLRRLLENSLNQRPLEAVTEAAVEESKISFYFS
jgi:hypothetical protein